MNNDNNTVMYILKYNDLIYYNLAFDQILEILLENKENQSPMTNRLLLIEMLKVICILENKTINIVSSEKYILKDIFDYNLIINSNESIIEIINDLKFAKIFKI